MRLLYLTVWNFSDAESNGICKKISSQVKTLKQMGFEVDFGYTKDGEVYLKHKEKDYLLGRVPVGLNIMLAYRVFSKKLKKKHYDAVYIRHSVVSPFYIHLLSVLSKNCGKIVVEVPTYPYDQELSNGFFLRMASHMDRIFRGRMKKYVDRIITYSKDDNIFGIPTIMITNGIDFSSIPKAKGKTEKDTLNLIGVAMLSPWHGFDRVIRGMEQYYKKGNALTVKFHIVGEGSELEKYKKMVKSSGLTSSVIFYGNQSGEALNTIYDQANIAISSIGLHRIHLETASPLKSREYGARGLLMVSSCKIDFIPDENLVYYVPADETDVNIEQLVQFYLSAINRHSQKEIGDVIREYTKKEADMEVTFAPVIKYLSE